MVPVEGDLCPWPPACPETSVGPPGRQLAVIAMIEVTAATLAAHPFLHGITADHLAVLARAASDVTVPAGHRFFEDGGHATCFWLVQSGHVTVDVDVPGQGRVPIGTIGMGELMGWSWLFPPFMWAFGAVAASPVETFEFDARTVRAKCASDPALGYEVTRRVAEVLTKRLKSTRSRLITVSMQPIGTR
jgi:CRP/FNR family transcriptional regulator, cyclic AMP receptor protein